VIADLPEGELPLSFLVRTGEVSGGMQKPDGLYELLFSRIDAARLQPAALLFGSEFTPPASRIMLQAIYTDVAALALLLAAAPLILAIAVLVKVTSPGPILDSQRTMGWRLRPFHLLRFRCHRVSTVRGAARELTPLGSMLRRLHLDALPQLFNVLRGEMTLVGPAPIRVEFAAALMETLPYHRMRYAAKPGLTGASQINVADQSDALAVLECDLYYMKRMSLFLDTSILRHALLPHGGAPEAARGVAGGGA
jgi:lipopolysaccharide/colanic/teichoic acid biosynthesis glycosyltransferase